MVASAHKFANKFPQSVISPVHFVSKNGIIVLLPSLFVRKFVLRIFIVTSRIIIPVSRKSSVAQFTQKNAPFTPLIGLRIPKLSFNVASVGFFTCKMARKAPFVVKTAHREQTLARISATLIVIPVSRKSSVAQFTQKNAPFAPPIGSKMPKLLSHVASVWFFAHKIPQKAPFVVQTAHREQPLSHISATLIVIPVSRKSSVAQFAQKNVFFAPPVGLRIPKLSFYVASVWFLAHKMPQKAPFVAFIENIAKTFAHTAEHIIINADCFAAKLFCLEEIAQQRVTKADICVGEVQCIAHNVAINNHTEVFFAHKEAKIVPYAATLIGKESIKVAIEPLHISNEALYINKEEVNIAKAA